MMIWFLNNHKNRMKLEISLLKISETEKFDQILFWGKVQGLKLDYYIAVGLQFKGKFEFPNKKFFWAKYSIIKETVIILIFWNEEWKGNEIFIEWKRIKIF